MFCQQLFGLEGKNAVVTGATSGIGASAALTYARAGANVFLIGRREERLRELCGKIRAYGVNAGYRACDVSSPEEVDKAAGEALSLFPQIHILLQAAGTTGETDIAHFDPAEWERELRVNLDGTAQIASRFLPNMIEHRYGRVVHVSSVNAFKASMTVSRHAYNASKAAVCGLTIGMSAAYAKYGVTVNAVCPGLFETEMTKEIFENRLVLATYNRQVPAGRPGKPGETDGLILFLSGDAASYLTGQCIAVDGGFMSSSYL